MGIVYLHGQQKWRFHLLLGSLALLLAGCLTALDIQSPVPRTFQLVNASKGETVTLGAERLLVTALVGQKLQLQPLGRPLEPGEATWTISDGAVAFISEQGELVALKEGATQIKLSIARQVFEMALTVRDLSPAELASRTPSKAAQPGIPQGSVPAAPGSPQENPSPTGAPVPPFPDVTDIDLNAPLPDLAANPQEKGTFTPVAAPLPNTVKTLTPRLVKDGLPAPQSLLNPPAFQPGPGSTGGSFNANEVFAAQVFLPVQDGAFVIGSAVPINLLILSLPPDIRAANPNNLFSLVIVNSLGQEVDRINVSGLAIISKWLNANVPGNYQLYLQAQGIAPASFNKKLADFSMNVTDPNAPPTNPNQAPKISSLLFDPNPALVNIPVQLILVPLEAEGDLLSFTWTATAGTFQNPFVQNPLWLAPANAGTYNVTVVISDGSLTATQTVSIPVQANSDGVKGGVFAIF